MFCQSKIQIYTILKGGNLHKHITDKLISEVDGEPQYKELEKMESADLQRNQRVTCTLKTP